ASVTLSANGTVAFTGTEVSAGSWAFMPTTSLAAGTYDLTARATDPYGDVTTGTFDLTVAPAPTAPTLALALSSQSPDFATDTDHTAPTIDISTGIASGTADANGSIALAPTLTIGAHALTATVTDSYGDHASSTPLDLTVYSVPNAPTLSLDHASISGTVTYATDIGTPRIDVGTDADAASVTLSANGTVAFTGTEVSAGSWAFTPTTSLAAGTYDLTARVTDPYGDVTTGTFDLTVAPAPTAPTLALALSNQSPDFATDTDHTAPTIDISTGIAGGTVTLTANGSVVASGTADANGSIAFTPTLTIGAHALTATVTDSYGDHATSGPFDLTVYSVPNAPTLSLDHASISGTVTYATDIGTPRIDVGTDADAASVTVSANGTVAFTGTEVSAGSWAFTPTTSLAAGTYDLTARVTDPYGDVTTGTFDLTVAPAPTAPTLALALSNQSPDFATDTDHTAPTIDISTGIAGGTVTLTANGSVVASGTADANGSIAFTPTLTIGAHALTATVTDSYGDHATSGPFDLTVYSVPNAPTLSLDHASISGTVTYATDIGTPRIDVGTDADAASVTVSANGTVAFTGTEVSAGSWAFTPTTSLAAGTYDLTARVTDPYGDVTTGTFDLTVAPAPTAPTLALALSNQSPDFATDTDHTAPTIDISTGIAGGTVTLTANGSVVASGTADANGSIAFTPTLTIGAHALTATVTDSYGDHATSGPFDLTVYSVPNAPTLSLDHASISGTVTYATDIGTPRIDVGTDADAASVTVSANGTVAFTGTEVSAGSWAFTPTTSLAAGTYDLTARVTDPYGDVTTGTFDLTVAPAPTAPTLALALSNQSPDFATDTDHTAPTIDISTGIAGGTVTLTANGSVVASGTADANGSIAFTPTLTIGAHALTATVTDSYGDHATSGPFDLTVYSVPNAPTLSLDHASISGTVTYATDIGTPRIDVGTDADAASVTVSANGTVAFTGTEVSAGSWAFTPTTSLAAGTYDLTARVTDPYGDVTTGTFDLTVAPAPTAPTLALALSNQSPDFATDTDHTAPTIDISTGIAGGTVTLTANGSVVASGTADANGSIAFTPTLTIGAHALTATVTDSYGDHATSGPFDLTVYSVPNAPTLSLDHASISGTVTYATDIGTPRIDVGTDADAASVTVSANGTVAFTGTEVSAGSWAFTPTTSLAAGTYDLTARVTDPYGDVTTGTFDLTVAPAPTAPTLALALSNQSPDFATDTDHTAPTIDISTGIAGGTVTLTANGSVVASGTADANGSIAFTPTLTIGAHALTATVTDSYGDHATSGPFDLTVYSVPNAPTVSLDHASISGTVTYATDIGTPRIDVGTDADAASVTLSANGTVAFTGTEVSAGSWAFMPTTSLAAGTYDLTARATDPYGDVTTGTFDLTVAPAPTAPTLALALSSQSPDFATDTDHTAPTIDISTGIAGGTVTLTANGSVVASGTQHERQHRIYTHADDRRACADRHRHRQLRRPCHQRPVRPDRLQRPERADGVARSRLDQRHGDLCHRHRHAAHRRRHRRGCRQRHAERQRHRRVHRHRGLRRVVGLHADHVARRRHL